MTDLRALLAELAVPRRSGSAANAQVRAALKRELGARAFVVLEHPVTLSPRPVWVVGTCARAIAVTAAAIAVAILLRPHEFLPQVLLAGLAGGFVLHALGALIGLLRCPWPAVAGVNLIGVRPRTRVAVWLTAHYDSKGQALSMAGRLVAIGLILLGALGVAALAAAQVAGVGPSGAAWLPALAALGVGGQRLARAGLRDDSRGAVDNVSGVLTALATLDALPADASIGVIFPDGEELGLQGARALVRERANLLDATTVVNLDGIDDRGPVIALVHRAGPVVDQVVQGVGATRWRRLPVVVDGRAFARVARACVTIMRGDWATMRQVHRPGDAPDRLTLQGVRDVSARIAAVLR